MPPLPERTLAESAGAALAAGGGGALAAGAAGAALADRPGGAQLVAARCVALRRFAARCAVHPLLRASPALDAFLRTTDEEVRHLRICALVKCN